MLVVFPSRPDAMPPRKKARVTGPDAQSSASLVDVNVAWLLERKKWIDTITGQLGVEILTNPPAEISAGGYLQPLTKDLLQNATQKDETSEHPDPNLFVLAGVNIMALSHNYSATPHVPLCRKRVQNLKDHWCHLFQ